MLPATDNNGLVSGRGPASRIHSTIIYHNVMAPKSVIPTSIPENESHASYEHENVHTVYDNIAHHFSSTRYKPWPVVAAFLASIPPGSVGLDAGAGNGKYLIAPPEREGKYWTIGLDRSINLLQIAQNAGGRDRECVLGDVLGSCWRSGVFVSCLFYKNYIEPRYFQDFAISIATIHHLSTPDRRKEAVKVSCMLGLELPLFTRPLRACYDVFLPHVVVDSFTSGPLNKTTYRSVSYPPMELVPRLPTDEDRMSSCPGY